METFDVYIEIPSGSRNKYEFDFKLKTMRFDRLLHSSMVYPAEYGFFPKTFALDGDPLDVLVLATDPFVPGLIVEVRPIGAFKMIDNGEEDDKIICVPVSDPFFATYTNIEDVNLQKRKEIEHFFQTYKEMQNKKVETNGFEDRDAAIKMIHECKERFKKLDNEKKVYFSL